LPSSNVLGYGRDVDAAAVFPRHGGVDHFDIFLLFLFFTFFITFLRILKRKVEERCPD